MQNKTLLIGFSLIVLVLIVVGVYVLQNNTNSNNSSNGQMQQDNTNQINSEEAVETSEVQIINMTFVQKVIKVKKGTTVTWTNNDFIPHTVTSDNNIFDSGAISPEGTYQFTFNETGTFTYHCLIHPEMTGGVIVE